MAIEFSKQGLSQMVCIQQLAEAQDGRFVGYPLQLGPEQCRTEGISSSISSRPGSLRLNATCTMCNRNITAKG